MKKIPDIEKNFEAFLTSHNEKMQFEELDFDEFKKALKSLKQNKATSFDNLSSDIITDAFDSVKNILSQVFKVSIQQGILPDRLKIAKVTLIFKSSDKDNIRNYRLISTLPVFFEKF